MTCFGFLYFSQFDLSQDKIHLNMLYFDTIHTAFGKIHKGVSCQSPSSSLSSMPRSGSKALRVTFESVSHHLPAAHSSFVCAQKTHSTFLTHFMTSSCNAPKLGKVDINAYLIILLDHFFRSDALSWSFYWQSENPFVTVEWDLSGIRSNSVCSCSLWMPWTKARKP